MQSSRARQVQNAVVVAVGLLGLACIVWAVGLIYVGSNPSLRSVAVRIGTGTVGSLLLLSAALATALPRWRRTLTKLVFSILFCVGLLALAEGAARLAGFRPEPMHPRDIYWIADPELGYACRPDFDFRFLTAQGWIEGHTDHTGYRPAIAGGAAPDAPAVICIGDSYTFCTEVVDDETWAEAAGRYLAEHGKPHRMLNRGIAGYSGLQCLLTLKRTLAGPGNFRAVVYHFCINDPAENFGSLVPIPQLRPAGSSFEIVPPKQGTLGNVSRAFIRPEFALLTAFRTWRFSTSERAYSSGARFSYGYTLNLCQRYVDEAPLRAGMRFVLAGMKAECDRHGLRFFVSFVNYPWWDSDGPARSALRALVPDADMDADARVYHAAIDELRRSTEEAGGEFMDTRGCLEGMTHREFAATPVDWHNSPAANDRVGRAIAARLLSKLK